MLQSEHQVPPPFYTWCSCCFSQGVCPYSYCFLLTSFFLQHHKVRLYNCFFPFHCSIVPFITLFLQKTPPVFRRLLCFYWCLLSLVFTLVTCRYFVTVYALEVQSTARSTSAIRILFWTRSTSFPISVIIPANNWPFPVTLNR